MISLSIDVLQLDKARFKQVTKRDGSKATYCDLIMIETPNGQYGDYMVKQSISKEERSAGKQMPILGNGKIFESRGGTSAKHTNPNDGPEGDEPPPF